MGSRAVAAGQQALQIGNGQWGGVDHQISAVEQRKEIRQALEPDPIGVWLLSG